MTTRSSRHLAITALMMTVLCLAGATPAMAYTPVGIVHTERVQAGPYGVTLGRAPCAGCGSSTSPGRPWR